MVNNALPLPSLSSARYIARGQWVTDKLLYQDRSSRREECPILRLDDHPDGPTLSVFLLIVVAGRLLDRFVG